MFGLGGLLIALSFVLFAGQIGAAQDATPPGATAPHPVHVHEGTCDNLDPAPLFPLNDITPPTPVDAAQAGGAPLAIESSTTTIDATLADLAGGNRAINVHESAENIGNYIACGDIGGAIVPGADADQGGHLAIGLGELNGSGYAGVAILREAGEAGTQTEVTMYLAQGLAGGATATTGAEHAAHEAAATGVTVDIKNFAYSPDPVTVAVGESVTWTNQDSAPHTATAKDREVLQSGTLNQGDSYTQTFEVAGTYEYVCEFHPNMVGTLIVE
jgi:plastocyanin